MWYWARGILFSSHVLFIVCIIPSLCASLYKCGMFVWYMYVCTYMNTLVYVHREHRNVFRNFLYQSALFLWSRVSPQIWSSYFSATLTQSSPSYFPFFASQQMLAYKHSVILNFSCWLQGPWIQILILVHSVLLLTDLPLHSIFFQVLILPHKH